MAGCNIILLADLFHDILETRGSFHAMNDFSITFSKLENPKKFEIIITTQLGCDFDADEYGLAITKIIEGCVDSGDYELIKECVYDHLDRSLLPEEGQLVVHVIESGEWEDVFWHKYYQIEKIEQIMGDL